MNLRINQTRCLGLFAALSLIGAASQAQFALNDIGLLPGGTTCSGVGVNSNGTAVAHCDDSQGRTLTVRKPPGQPFQLMLSVAQNTCRAVAINPLNTVSANCVGDRGETVPVRWMNSGNRVLLSPLPGLLGLLPDLSARGGAINDTDWIVGTSMANNGSIRPVVWPPGPANPVNPEMLPVPNLLTHGFDAVACRPAGVENTAVASNGPLIVGNCSVNVNGDEKLKVVRWQRNAGGAYAVTVLDTFPNIDSNCTAVAIADGGAVAGNCTGPSDEPQAVYWAGGGTALTSIAPMIPGGSARSTVSAMLGDLVVGSFRTSSGFEHAYFWQAPNLSFVDIGVLPGGFNSRATGIFVAGFIPAVVGISEVGGGASHAFAWAGTIYDLGTLGGPNSKAIATGGPRFIGTSHVANGQEHAFIN